MEIVNSGQNFSISSITMEFLMRNKDGNLSNCYGYSLDGHLQNSEPSCNLPMQNFFLPNISKGKSRGEIPFMIPANIRKNFENFTRYINSKEHSLLRETIDHLDKMSSDYTDFINSPRAYSDVSNSIASYLIGGFVGSKSQMNSEKHKLSYDLGGVIFKILQDCKCVRPYYKLREDKKCEISRFGKRPKFKDSNSLIHDVICKNLINKSNDIETKQTLKRIHCLNENGMSTCGSMEMEDGKGNCLAVNREPENYNIGTILKAKNISKEELYQIPNNYECLDTCFIDKEEMVDSINSENQSSPNNQYKDGQNQSNKCASDQKSDLVSLNSLHHVDYLTLGIRRRQFSECSVESTDSDSFIVFDDKYCVEHQNSILPESENDESDYFEEDGTYASNDDDSDDSCWIETTDECDNEVEDKEVAEANAKWSELYKDVESSLCISEGRVRFKDEVTIHRMVAWDFAYRAARPGPWEQMAHDRGRFKERIQRLSSVISPVLQDVHRKSIYEKLYG